MLSLPAFKRGNTNIFKKENQNELSTFIKAEETILWPHTFSNILRCILARLLETEQANAAVYGFCDKNCFDPFILTSGSWVHNRCPGWMKHEVMMVVDTVAILFSTFAPDRLSVHDHKRNSSSSSGRFKMLGFWQTVKITNAPWFEGRLLQSFCIPSGQQVIRLKSGCGIFTFVILIDKQQRALQLLGRAMVRPAQLVLCLNKRLVPKKLPNTCFSSKRQT